MSIITQLPVIDTNLQHKPIKVIGALENNFRPWVSTSYSNNSSTFNCPPPSPQTFFDRCIYIRQPMVITYAGTTTGSALLQAGYDAPRQLPIHSIINNIQMTYNNQTFSSTPYQWIHALEEYHKQVGNKNLSPEYPDKFQNYVDGILANNNPLGIFTDSVGNVNLRGAFPSVIVNGATASTITLDVIEAIRIPPCLVDEDCAMGFSNCKSLTFNFTYIPTLSRVVSHATSLATLSGVTVALSQPTLYFRYFTQPEGFVPRPLNYGHQIITPFVTASTTLTANSTATISSTNIMFQAVPAMVYVYVQESDAYKTYASSDTYANINAMSITFNNKVGILSTATEQELYEIAKNHGYKKQWEDWHGIVQSSTLATVIGTSGSVLRLDFGDDIPIGDLQIGENGTFNLQMNVTVKNVNQTTSMTQPTLYIIAVTPATFSVDVGGNSNVSLGSGDFSNAEYVDYHSVKKYVGGSFMDIIGKVNKFLKDAKAISTIANLVSLVPHPGVSGVASTIGTTAKQMGYGSPQVGGMSVAGMNAAGMQLAGKHVTRSSLMNRIIQA